MVKDQQRAISIEPTKALEPIVPQNIHSPSSDDLFGDSELLDSHFAMVDESAFLGASTGASLLSLPSDDPVERTQHVEQAPTTHPSHANTMKPTSGVLSATDPLTTSKDETQTTKQKHHPNDNGHGLNSWNIYQQYFAANQSEEIARLSEQDQIRLGKLSGLTPSK